MKIIKRGQIPGETTHRATCDHCNTEVEFQEREAEKEFDRNQTGLKVECPVCKYVIWKWLP